MRQTPRLSIILPVLNAENLIHDTVQSALSQTFKHFELLVMDGGSSDYTPEIARAFGDPRVIVTSQRDNGAADAFNKGLARARGDFVISLNAGDKYIDRNFFKECMDIFDADPEVSLVWGLSVGYKDGVSVPLDPPFVLLLNNEGIEASAKILVKKAGRIIKELIIASPTRKKILLKNILSPGARLKLNHMVSQKMPGLPQKRAWIRYWMKTGLVFPDQSMLVTKKIWRQYRSDREMGQAAHTDFYFDFSSNGYLPVLIPKVVHTSLIHEGLSTEFMDIMQKESRAYFERVRRFAQSKPKIIFRDRSGKEI